MKIFLFDNFSLTIDDIRKNHFHLRSTNAFLDDVYPWNFNRNCSSFFCLCYLKVLRLFLIITFFSSRQAILISYHQSLPVDAILILVRWSFDYASRFVLLEIIMKVISFIPFHQIKITSFLSNACRHAFSFCSTKKSFNLDRERKNQRNF